MGRKRHTPEQIINCTAGGRGRSGPRQIREADERGARHHRADVLPVEAGVRRDEGEPGTAPEGARARERAPEASSGGLDTGQADPGGSGQGKLLSPERRRRCVARVRQQLGASERRACRVLGQPRTTQRRARKVASDEGALRRGAVSESIRPLRLPTRHGHAPHRGLGGEPQAGGADLEAGGAEGAGAAAEARSAVAQRRIVHPAEAAVSGPRLFVRHGPPEYLRSDNGPEVHREARAAVVGARGRRDALYRAGQPVGERLQRELQRQAQGRAVFDGTRGDTEASFLVPCLTAISRTLQARSSRSSSRFSADSGGRSRRAGPGCLPS